MAISGGSVVTVVQASKPRSRDNATVRQRRTPACGRVLAQSEMGSIIVIVGDVIGKQSPQVSLVQGNNVVKQLATAAADPALRHPILPRTSNGGPHWGDVHRANCGGHFESVLGM